MLGGLRFKQVWVIYFFVKLFYMVFAIYVYSRLTTLGDTFEYINAPLIISPKVLYSSTAMMQFMGAICKMIFRVDVLACLPFMLLSFYGVYYAVDRLDLYQYSTYIIILFSLPNFGVWTSILGKEAIGCFFSCVIAVMLIKKMQGVYSLKFIDYFALYLGAVFKPQYLLFVLQAFVFLLIVNRFKDKKFFPMALGVLIIGINVAVIYYFRDTIDALAKGMAIHFSSNDTNLARSTRSEAPWLTPYGFFKAAPYGMFISFFGPTLGEMLTKPAQLIAGLESLVMIICLTFLLVPRLRYNIGFMRFDPTIFVVFILVFIGILFIHYPFGFLNPGSAIRYRSNFYPLFVLMLIYLFTKQIRYSSFNTSIR